MYGGGIVVGLINSFPKEFIYQNSPYLDKYINDYSKVKTIEEQKKVSWEYSDIFDKKKSFDDLEKLIETIEKEEEINKQQIASQNSILNNSLKSQEDLDKQIEILKLEKEILELKAKLDDKSR